MYKKGGLNPKTKALLHRIEKTPQYEEDLSVPDRRRAEELRKRGLLEIEYGAWSGRSIYFRTRKEVSNA